jgi:hypothetical protein
VSDDPILAGIRRIDAAQSTPLHDAIDRLGQSGPGLSVDVDRTGVTAQGSIGLGHDVSVAGAAQKSFAQRGWDWMVGLRWTPKRGAR